MQNDSYPNCGALKFRISTSFLFNSTVTGKTNKQTNKEKTTNQPTNKQTKTTKAMVQEVAKYIESTQLASWVNLSIIGRKKKSAYCLVIWA